MKIGGCGAEKAVRCGRSGWLFGKIERYMLIKSDNGLVMLGGR